MKTIVYDWNGTLFDDANATHDAINFVLKECGYKPSPIEAFRDHYDMPIANLYRGVGVSEHELPKIEGVFKETFHGTYEAAAAKLPLRGGVTALLAKAAKAGVRQLILSNHIEDNIRYQTDRFDLTRHFEAIIANVSVERQFKDGPKGEKLRRYMALHNIAPVDTLIIGDSPEEIIIGHDLGLTTVGITGGFVSEKRIRSVNPDYMVHSIPAFEGVLSEAGFLPSLSNTEKVAS